MAGMAEPELDELVVGDEPDAWRGAGFTVDDDVCRVGKVRIRLVGRAGGKRIRSWSLRGLPAGTDEVDGIPTTGSEQPACPHCESRQLEKLLSVPAAHTAGSAELPVCRPAPAGGGCGLPQCGMGGCMME